MGEHCFFTPLEIKALCITHRLCKVERVNTWYTGSTSALRKRLKTFPISNGVNPVRNSRAYGLVVERGIRIAETPVRFWLGPYTISNGASSRDMGSTPIRSKMSNGASCRDASSILARKKGTRPFSRRKFKKFRT